MTKQELEIKLELAVQKNDYNAIQQYAKLLNFIKDFENKKSIDDIIQRKGIIDIILEDNIVFIKVKDFTPLPLIPTKLTGILQEDAARIFKEALDKMETDNLTAEKEVKTTKEKPEWYLSMVRDLLRQKNTYHIKVAYHNGEKITKEYIPLKCISEHCTSPSYEKLSLSGKIDAAYAHNKKVENITNGNIDMKPYLEEFKKEQEKLKQGKWLGSIFIPIDEINKSASMFDEMIGKVKSANELWEKSKKEEKPITEDNKKTELDVASEIEKQHKQIANHNLKIDCIEKTVTVQQAKELYDWITETVTENK